MKVTYDMSSGFMYVSTVDQPAGVLKTRQLAPGVMADYDSKNRMVGIEIWGSVPITLEVTR